MKLKGANRLSKIYSNIFLLNNIVRLTSLDKIFSKQYKEILPHVKKDKDIVDRMQDSEKYFFYTWGEIGKVEQFNVPNINNDSEEEIIQFQKAVANIEYTKRKRKDNFGNFLPKEERVNNAEIELLFFEKDRKIYVLILTSNEYHISRVKALIGEQNLSHTNSEYTLEPDLFNWLFYVYTERKGTLNEDIKLENISGFVGNVSDDANVFTGESYHTTELVVTKAFISNGGELKKIQLRVRDKDADITCMVNEHSAIVLSGNLSNKLRIMDNMEKSTFLLLYLYGYLILKLKQLFYSESDKFINEDNPNFSKKIGLDVIKSIVEKNNIVLEDIQHFLPSAQFSKELSQ